MIHEIRITPQKSTDKRAQDLFYEILNTLGIKSIEKVSATKVYRLEGCSEHDADQFAQRALEEISHTYTINKKIASGAQHVVEVALKPGVMNPEASSVIKATKALGVTSLATADTSWEYHLYGSVSEQELDHIVNRLLMNKTVEHVLIAKPTTLAISGSKKAICTVAIRLLNDQKLLELSHKYQLFLRLNELKAIQHYFITIERDPFDAELETIAQTWSEHCSHKTFKADLVVDGVKKPSLMRRLKETSQKYHQDVVSAFVDNAGVYRFYDGYAILGKVETHNSPSAIEPYGGAATGSGGVFRDIIGTGQGAKTISSTDMFCFAPPDLDMNELPVGCLHPNYLLRRVVAGVRDYGNRMGIPTNNGSVHFHKDFRAKPTVIVGAYGIAPEKYCKKAEPQSGDRIIALGGRTGRDGIHGATFSSGEMNADTESSCSSAVQIGNPITEKCFADAIIVCRDRGLIRTITDCGAGGFSSAIGEMGEPCGAQVHLENAPLKYSGLAPWEIWISESQERMVCAVAPELVQQFMQICHEHNVEATDLGQFTNTGRLQVYYQGNTLCDLDMQFLHEGNPHNELVATSPLGISIQTVEEKNSSPAVPGEASCEAWEVREGLRTEQDWITEYKKQLSDWNVCSKEPIVRQYDHGVQGTNVLPPFTGKKQNGPNDAVVIAPLLGKPYGMIIAHGMNPVLNKTDPYQGALWAVAECLANYTAVGGDVSQAALIDNFIWPYPDEESLWALDRAVDACVDAMNAFKIPFISGKDSLSSTYRYTDGSTLKIPPVLCVSVFGKIPDITKTITADFKKAGSVILFVGELDTQSDVPNIQLDKLPDRFAKIHARIASGAVLSCHDISEGGIGVALAEMCFGGQLGAQIDLCGLGATHEQFFNETAGCFLLEVPEDKLSEFSDLAHIVLGYTQIEPLIECKNLFSVALDSLQEAWQQPLNKVFHR